MLKFFAKIKFSSCLLCLCNDFTAPRLRLPLNHYQAGALIAHCCAIFLCNLGALKTTEIKISLRPRNETTSLGDEMTNLPD